MGSQGNILSTGLAAHGLKGHEGREGEGSQDPLQMAPDKSSYFKHSNL